MGVRVATAHPLTSNHLIASLLVKMNDNLTVRLRSEVSLILQQGLQLLVVVDFSVDRQRRRPIVGKQGLVS